MAITVGLLDARAHLSVMPSACAPDCNTPHTKQELVAGAPRRRSAFGPGTRDAQFRSGVPHSHFATAIPARLAVVDTHRPHPGHKDMSVGTIIVAHQIGRR